MSTHTYEIEVSHSGVVIATYYRDSELDARILVNNMTAAGYSAFCRVLNGDGDIVRSFA